MDKPKTKNVSELFREFIDSRSLRLSISIVMLMLSVLFAADFLGLRSDEQTTIRNARSLVSQSLAVQLSTLASLNNVVDIERAVAGFVDSNDDVLAAGLISVYGNVLASYGGVDSLDTSSGENTLTHISVPIMENDLRWGEVKVVFSQNNIWKKDLRWFGFFIVSALLVCYLFLRKTLVQLDPSRAIPGRVDSAFNLFSEGVLILDENLRIVMSNTAAAELVKSPVEKLVGKTLDEWPWLRDDGWQAPWATTLHSGLDIVDKPLRLEAGIAESRLFMVSCSLVGSAEDTHHGVLVTLDDMTIIEQKNQELANTLQALRKTQENITAQNRELEILATSDPLTGLYNRRVLMSNLDDALNDSVTFAKPLSCIMVDIDHFKKVNDNHGHTVGDDVIKAVAGTLQQASRELDTVGRYGGEEFMLVLPGLDAAESLEVAERIRKVVFALSDQKSFPLDRISVSLGVADLSVGANTAGELIEQADNALYVAKQAGRNRVVVYSPSIVTDEIVSDPEDISPYATDERVEQLEAMLKQRNLHIEKLSKFDDLTGAPTRKLLLQRVGTEIERSSRQHTGIGVLSFEIRDISRVILTFGQRAYNDFLVEFVDRLHDGLRSTDLVSEISSNHSLSRINSNEYGVLLSDLGESVNAMPVITRLRRILSEPFAINDEPVFIGVNIGIALYPQCGDSAEQLLVSANRARFEASLSSDKVAHVFASDSLDEASRNYIRLESQLHDAVKKKEFELYYQPKYDLAQRRVTGLEALLRWNQPELGFISPESFIPVAEASGLIGELFDFVFDSALTKISELEKLGHTELSVSINLSPVQLRDSRLVEKILKAVEHAGIKKERLEIELTESAVIDNRDFAIEALGQLRRHGIRISMDDFGTGYTSLALLADLPLDTVKIDRTFIDGIDSSAKSRAIVEAVINMAHSLDLSVVAEGVETNEQLTSLTALGCNEIQGYLISHPISSEYLLEFLQQNYGTRSSRSA